jgi:hypothetical protein
MRDPARIPKILERLGKIWAENPDLRLGQLVMAARPPAWAMGGQMPGRGEKEELTHLFYMEDDALVSALERVLSQPARATLKTPVCPVCTYLGSPCADHADDE